MILRGAHKCGWDQKLTLGKEDLFLMCVVSLNASHPAIHIVGSVSVCTGNDKSHKNEKYFEILKVCFLHRNQKNLSLSCYSIPALNTVPSFLIALMSRK